MDSVLRWSSLLTLQHSRWTHLCPLGRETKSLCTTGLEIPHWSFPIYRRQQVVWSWVGMVHVHLHEAEQWQQHSRFFLTLRIWWCRRRIIGSWVWFFGTPSFSSDIIGPHTGDCPVPHPNYTHDLCHRQQPNNHHQLELLTHQLPPSSAHKWFWYSCLSSLFMNWIC